MHFDDGNVIHKPIKILTNERLVEFVLEESSSSNFLENLDAIVLERANALGDEFISKLVDELLTLAPARRLHETGSCALPLYVCNKHKHYSWCDRMSMLEKYTALAIRYHHACKYKNFGRSSDQHISALHALKAAARACFYSTRCSCGGLR